MSKHKKQHFVTSSYLKAWCDPQCPKNQTPYVWMFSKDGKSVKRKAPDNILHETDIYTIKGENGERNLTLEHGLQQLETNFARVRKLKLRNNRELNAEENAIICEFIAATKSRTKASRDHWKKNWEGPFKRMEEMIEWERTATPEDMERAAQMSIIPHGDNNGGLDYEHVKELYENPLQNMMPILISTLTPMLMELNLAIFCTKSSPGFITSDSPCVWFDPEAYKKPPLYRAPVLASPTIEITLPVSPEQCILLCHHNYAGYLNVPDRLVEELNRRIRSYADECFVVNKNTLKEYWFDPGKEPNDSWENIQRKKENNTEQTN